MMTLSPINLEHYVDFAKSLFKEYQKDIAKETITEIYQRYEGVTWYVQSVLNALFTLTKTGETCSL